MKGNVGIVDRVLRFALAFWWLGPFGPQFAAAWANWTILIVGLIALVENFVAYCPLHTMLGINNK